MTTILIQASFPRKNVTQADCKPGRESSLHPPSQNDE